jgi:hypothetical protein
VEFVAGGATLIDEGMRRGEVSGQRLPVALHW